jgi:hypothetical protein
MSFIKQKYIGTKIVEAEKWDVPPTKNGFADPINNLSGEGYKVYYPQLDGSVYESWCPKVEFDRHYRPVEGFTFGIALELLKQGKKVMRSGWNGKGMFVFLREGRMIENVDPSTPMGGNFESLSHLCLKTADDKCMVGWTPNMLDCLAEDWMQHV